MSFPLAKKVLIRGSDAHLAAGLGEGMDYKANFENLYMPFDGKVDRIYYGTQGGKWLDIIDKDGIRLQFAHLDAYFTAAGQTNIEGAVIARTGNTGAVTTGPHLHIQGIKSGKRVRLDDYNWNQQQEVPPMAFRVHNTEEEWFREVYGYAVGTFKQGGPAPADVDYGYNVLRKQKYGNKNVEECIIDIVREQFNDELTAGWDGSNTNLYVKVPVTLEGWDLYKKA